MGGLVWLQSWAGAPGIGDRCGLESGRLAHQVLRVQQAADGDIDEIGITEIFRAVGKHPLFDLRQQVHVARGVVRDIFKERPGEIHDTQQLQKCEPAGAGWRRRQDLVALPIVLQGSAP